MTDRGTYIKMSDSLPEHRKIVAAGGDAAWLHVCALAYSSRNLTDGIIPVPVVPRLSDRRNPQRLAQVLIGVDLWHAADHHCKRCPQPAPGEYVIHDYLEHQRSAARVAELSAKRAESGRAGGLRPKAKRKQIASGLLDDCSDVAEANSKRSFTEEVLRTSQTEELLRSSQAEADVPPPAPAAPTAGTRSARAVTGNVGDVVAAFVDGARGAGLDEPAASLKARVGKQARLLLAEGKPLDRLIQAAGHMGAGEWNDLAVQLRKDDAAANGRTGRSVQIPNVNYADEEYSSGW